MGTRAKRVEAALEREGLRGHVNAIDQGRDGEVILWYLGGGHPVASVREAVAIVRDAFPEPSEDDDD